MVKERGREAYWEGGEQAGEEEGTEALSDVDIKRKQGRMEPAKDPGRKSGERLGIQEESLGIRAERVGGRKGGI